MSAEVRGLSIGMMRRLRERLGISAEVLIRAESENSQLPNLDSLTKTPRRECRGFIAIALDSAPGIQ